MPVDLSQTPRTGRREGHVDKQSLALTLAFSVSQVKTQCSGKANPNDVGGGNACHSASEEDEMMTE